MRPNLIRVSAPQDICIFCATRLQLLRPTHNSRQRRRLRSSSLHREYATGAAAAKQDEAQRPSLANAPSTNGAGNGGPRFGPGFSAAMRGEDLSLTPEEQAIRDALVKQAETRKVSERGTKKPQRGTSQEKPASWDREFTPRETPARMRLGGFRNDVDQEAPRISMRKWQLTPRERSGQTAAEPRIAWKENDAFRQSTSQSDSIDRYQRSRENYRSGRASNGNPGMKNNRDVERGRTENGAFGTLADSRNQLLDQRIVDARPHQRRGDAVSRHPTRSQSDPAQWVCTGCGHANTRFHDTCSMCSRVPQQTHYTCAACGHRNPESRERCQKCANMNPYFGAKLEQANGRKDGNSIEKRQADEHYRQNDSSARVEANNLPFNRGQRQVRMLDQVVTQKEREQKERLEQSRDGKFVGFSNQPKNPTSKDYVRSQLVGQPWTSEAPSPNRANERSGGTLNTLHDLLNTGPELPRGQLFKDFRSQATQKVDKKESSVPISDSSVRQLTVPSAGPLHEDASVVRQKMSFPALVDTRSQLVSEAGTMYPPENLSQADASSQEAAIGPREVRRASKFVVDEAAMPATFAKKPKFDNSRNRERQVAHRRRQNSDDQDEDEDVEVLSRVEQKRQRKLERLAHKAAMAPPTPIVLPEFISIGNLAMALKVRSEHFTQKLYDLGFQKADHDYVLDAETAGLIASEFNFEPIVEPKETEDLVALPPTEDELLLVPRPPVITIMGHVDHGKTTLLDWLRKSSVAASEHGGITQHIGAFTVPMPSGKIITFLDTPGHAAFLSMRKRGANVTDIVILVVAADDSVKPQTIEAINHAQGAKVPIIVAINKIDKEDANPDRVKQDLARHGVNVEDYGGDTQAVLVSGKTGRGMEELEDAAVTLADILDMRAETSGQAEGWVLEASKKAVGKVATVLVRRGTIQPGAILVAGSTWTRVRSLRNEAGQTIPSAGPGTPVEIDGWRDQPEAGDEVLEAPTEQRAKNVVDLRVTRAERDKMAADVIAVNEARKLEQEIREQEREQRKQRRRDGLRYLSRQAQAVFGDHGKATSEGDAAAAPDSDASRLQEVPFLVRADVSGSVEAILNAMAALGNASVRPSILRAAVGPITPSDVELAAAARGSLLSFNLPVDGAVARLADANAVPLLDHNIIYQLVEHVRATLEDVLPPLRSTRVLGEADVGKLFDVSVKGRGQVAVAGCKVRNGVISKEGRVRVLRGGDVAEGDGGAVVFDGLLSSLKNVKKDVAEMRKGGECGLMFDGWGGAKEGDRVQCYEEVVEKRTL